MAHWPGRILSLAAAILVLSGCGGSGGGTAYPSAASFQFPMGKTGTRVSPGFDAVVANKFRVSGSNNIEVTALGTEVIMPTQDSKLVAICDATSGTILASATVSTADTVNNGYFYKAITPVTLIAGKTYYIAALRRAGTASTYLDNTNVASTPAYISDEGTFYKISSDIASGTWEPTGGIRHYVAAFESRRVSP